MNHRGIALSNVLLLLRLRPEDSTVTQVAADVGGFFNLGRFAGEYLAMFGEHPSATLHRPAG